jgi:hypothetical protein
MTAKDTDPDDWSGPLASQTDDIPRIRSPDPYPVAVGILIIVSIYFFPIFPAPAPATGTFTLADIVTGGYSHLFPWSPMLIITFVIGWIGALAFIAAGLLNTRPDLSFEEE